MPFYEVIFEVGTHSIMNAESDEAVQGFAEIQHQRAKSGLPNGPAGDRADRVVRILRYDEDPGNPVTDLPVKEIQARVKEVAADIDTDADGNVSMLEVARLLVPPAILDTPVHESNFAMQSTGELDPTTWGGGGSVMAAFTFNRMSLMGTDYVMGASATITPPTPWKIALATSPTSGYNKSTSVWSATVSGANVNEIGATTANGYARTTINKDQTGAGWPAATTDATGATTTGAQVTFSFTGAPSTNGANSWVCTDGTTLNAGQLYFSADTAATRTFANGDTEKVTPSLKGT